MVASGYRLLLLLSATSGPALLGGPFLLGIPHQDRMDTPLPEVHPPGDPHPDFPGPRDTQHLREDNLCEDKGSLGVLTPVNYPLSFYGQNVREASTHCSCRRGIPASRLRG